ncbi:MAG: hypothetical protein QOE72_2185 [Chloroflexota bacterium]|jgi:hypothetical protein|nr:hypothetical protein [Chloroflexota bacterium]
MTLPTPLRTARAIALFQGWAAGLGVFVMLGVAVLAAGGLRNGAFVALALLFLAGDVLAVSTAVVIAARRLSEGAAWARLLLDVVEGVTVAVGLLAILMGTGALGVFGVVLGLTVIVCLHMPSSNAMFAGQPILPWEAPSREPEAPVFPVPSMPRRTRSATRPPMPTPPAPAAPAPRAQPPVGTPVLQPSPRTGPYSWETLPTPLAPPPAPAAAAVPPAPPADPLPLITPPVVTPPEEPPARPFVVPPLEKLTVVPRHGTPSPAEPAEAPAIRPFVVPSPEERAATAEREGGEQPGRPATEPAPPPSERPAADTAPAPPPEAPEAPAAPPPAPAIPTPTAPDRWEPRRLPPVAAATARPASASTSVYERRYRTSLARPGRSATPPPPSWAWRKVVIAASLLGAVGGGTLSAVELLAGGGNRLPSTGLAPAPAPPPSGGLPGGGTNPAPPRPGGERSEPAAAGGVSAVTVTPEGACGVGSCTVTVRVDLQPHQDELVAWSLVVVDRCSSQRVEVPVTGVPAPASYRYVTSTNQVTVPGWRSPQIIAITTSPARASSQPIVVDGGSGC